MIISDDKLPDEFNGFKIVHLSDLHNKDWGTSLIEPVKEYRPDMIVITGDLIDSETEDLAIVTNLIKNLVQISKVYFVSGNHEAWNDLSSDLEIMLTDNHVIVLNNTSVLFSKNQQSIAIMGMEDPSFHASTSLLNEQEVIFEETLRHLALSHDNRYTLLLSHRPEYFEAYARNGYDLVFSGHAHGGQFRMPFIGGLIAPDQGFFPRYTAGIYERDRTKMIVSRGMGNSVIPIRINNRPELIFIELVQ